MEDVDGAEGDEVFPNEDEDGHDHSGEDQFDMFDEDGVELIDQENDGQYRSLSCVAAVRVLYGFDCSSFRRRLRWRGSLPGR
jgi:hypothetical protein